MPLTAEDAGNAAEFALPEADPPPAELERLPD
ncbi:MAG: Uncharacterised protein [Prochlorococcus marinus str. MIT 9215]|nr:MAG: Uncharacterised protein [Prochlorococcus marinus str. MIT 9215]